MAVRLMFSWTNNRALCATKIKSSPMYPKNNVESSKLRKYEFNEKKMEKHPKKIKMYTHKMHQNNRRKEEKTKITRTLNQNPNEGTRLWDEMEHAT